MRITLLLPLLFSLSGCLTNSASASINDILKNDEFSNDFKQTFLKVYEKGPNFNSEDFVVTYPCGGGAVCGSIFDSSSNRFVSFPDDFIGASEKQEFGTKFNVSSNQLCISGESAYTLEVYKNACYEYDGVALHPVQ